MSSAESLGEDDTAMRKFWETPELVEKLLPYLDLNSTKHLAESHKLTRKILKKDLTWYKLIQRFLPGEERIEFLVDQSFGPPFPFEDDPLLASEMQKARILAEVLSLISGDSMAWLSLVHAICERNPIRFSGTVIIGVSCSCLLTHRVSPWGFLLLKQVEASLGSKDQGKLEVETIKMFNLGGSLLMALASKVAGQQGIVKELDVQGFVCDNKESAEAIATLVEQCQALTEEDPLRICMGWGFVEDEDEDGDPIDLPIDTEEIGTEGWATIGRAVKHIFDTFRKEVTLLSDTKTMGTGTREDLKAIWDNVSKWEVEGYGGTFRFSKELDGEDGWWVRNGNRRGLVAFINMTEEEWNDEWRMVADAHILALLGIGGD